MAGAKETFEIELNVDHRIFIKSVVEQYGIGSEDKALRVIMDFIQTNPDLHESVFTAVSYTHLTLPTILLV